MITSVMSFTKFHKISGNMITSSKKSRDLGYHFDFFFGSTYAGYDTYQIWGELDKYFSRKLGG